MQAEVAKLASKGQEASDLLTYLWKAYFVVNEKKFVAYIKWLKDEHDEGRIDRIPSTTPGAEPPRDAKDSGSARSHPTHLETSFSNRP